MVIYFQIHILYIIKLKCKQYLMHLGYRGYMVLGYD